MRRYNFKLKRTNKKFSTSYINIPAFRQLTRMALSKRKERKIWLMYLAKNPTVFHKAQVKSMNNTLKKLEKLIKVCLKTAKRTKGK